MFKAPEVSKRNRGGAKALKALGEGWGLCLTTLLTQGGQVSFSNEGGKTKFEKPQLIQMQHFLRRETGQKRVCRWNEASQQRSRLGFRTWVSLTPSPRLPAEYLVSGGPQVPLGIWLCWETLTGSDHSRTRSLVGAIANQQESPLTDSNPPAGSGMQL